MTLWHVGARAYITGFSYPLCECEFICPPAQISLLYVAILMIICEAFSLE